MYVVSGSERQMVRVMVSDPLHIPESHIIGTDMEINASNQGDVKEDHYDYRKDDFLVRGKSAVRNLKMNKVVAIAREIGKLSFVKVFDALIKQRVRRGDKYGVERLC